jgi:hypothetical protein
MDRDLRALARHPITQAIFEKYGRKARPERMALALANIVRQSDKLPLDDLLEQQFKGTYHVERKDARTKVTIRVPEKKRYGSREGAFVNRTIRGLFGENATIEFHFYGGQPGDLVNRYELTRFDIKGDKASLIGKRIWKDMYGQPLMGLYYRDGDMALTMDPDPCRCCTRVPEPETL